MFGRTTNPLHLYQSTIAPFVNNLTRVLGIRFDKSPIQTMSSLNEFVQTRSAYVAQTSLYGYLKTRMGTRYVSMFQDEVFSNSIAKAKWRIYASCLSDLTVFVTGIVATDGKLTDKDAIRLANRIYLDAIDATFHGDDASEIVSDVVRAFEMRCGTTDWAEVPVVENAFTVSPVDLIRHAPVVDEFKLQDSEIVTNSIRFRWRDVREQLRKRIDSQSILNDWVCE